LSHKCGSAMVIPGGAERDDSAMAKRILSRHSAIGDRSG
jgi:hypothetical protein